MADNSDRKPDHLYTLTRAPDGRRPIVIQHTLRVQGDTPPPAGMQTSPRPPEVRQSTPTPPPAHSRASPARFLTGNLGRPSPRSSPNLGPMPQAQNLSVNASSRASPGLLLRQNLSPTSGPQGGALSPASLQRPGSQGSPVQHLQGPTRPGSRGSPGQILLGQGAFQPSNSPARVSINHPNMAIGHGMLKLDIPAGQFVARQQTSPSQGPPRLATPPRLGTPNREHSPSRTYHRGKVMKAMDASPSESAQVSGPQRTDAGAMLGQMPIRVESTGPVRLPIPAAIPTSGLAALPISIRDGPLGQLASQLPGTQVTLQRPIRQQSALALMQYLQARKPQQNIPQNVPQNMPQHIPQNTSGITTHVNDIKSHPSQVPQIPPPPRLHMAPRLLNELQRHKLDVNIPRESPCNNIGAHSPNDMPQLVPEGHVAHQNEVNCKPELVDGVKEENHTVEPDKQSGIKTEENNEDDLMPMETPPFNMRVATLANFPVAQNTYRATYRSHSLAIHRAKAGAITSAAKSLDLLRQNLQKHINKEIDEIIQKYLAEYFKPGIENIKLNNGESAVSEEHIQGVCRQILEEAKKMYSSETRSTTPLAELSDNVSESGSLVENRCIRKAKHSLFNIRKRRGSSDSESSTHVRKKKKGRPPLHTQGLSGRSTPSKTGKSHEPVKREGPKWDPDRLKTDTLFVMGARANKALGLGATRGRLYIKHPDMFKYSGDQDDKQWLYENHHMPATGGKAYMLLVEDIRELAQTDEYKDSPGLLMDEVLGFTVPQWMVDKMKIQMRAMRTDTPKPKHRSRSATPNVVGGQDIEDNGNAMPFSSEESTPKLGDMKSELVPSPANTEDMDLLSTDQDDHAPDVSPFNMTGAFDDGSPAPVSPSPSDIDGLDDDAPLTAPFDIHVS